MIRPALALLPSLLIMLASLGPPDRDQVEARWEDSPPGERVASAIEATRPPPTDIIVSEKPIAATAIVAPAPTIVVETAVVYSQTIPPASQPQAIALSMAPADIGALVSVYFPDPATAARMTRVIGCESTFNPTAISPAGDRGLTQIAAVHARYDPALGTSFIGSLGYTWDDMLSPGPNLAVAAALLRSSGWSAWACS